MVRELLNVALVGLAIVGQELPRDLGVTPAPLPAGHAFVEHVANEPVRELELLVRAPVKGAGRDHLVESIEQLPRRQGAHDGEPGHVEASAEDGGASPEFERLR